MRGNGPSPKTKIFSELCHMPGFGPCVDGVYGGLKTTARRHPESPTLEDPMSKALTGKRIAILVTDGFEQVELTGPKEALEQAGATVEILSTEEGQVKGWNHDKPADDFKIDRTFKAANASDYHGVVLPGGVQNSDTIRIDTDAQKLVKDIEGSGKPVAVICHGGWLLISAGLVKGKTLTSFKTLKDDLVNAGAKWVDQEVVTDGTLISSRQPDDIPAFNSKLIEALSA
ncbi:Protease PfpI [Pseudomonas syringae pv. rhaphiolepidis]|nr:Protease PfpI [Pseudomonas syringae pv. rhaphiolepidis]